MGFDSRDFVKSKVSTMGSQMLQRFKKAVERKHFYGFMETEIYEFTMERIEEREKELSK